MAGALENRGKNRGLALAQKKAKEKNKTGALTLRGQDRDKKNRGGLAGGIGYVAGNLGLGLANVGEGILDISMAAGDLLQGDTDMAKYRFLNNMSGNAQKRLQEDYNPNGAMKLAGDVASGIGNSLTFLIPYAGPYLAAAGYMGMGVSSAAERTGDVGAKELGYGVVSGSMEFLMDKFIGASGRAYKSIGASITRKLGREAAEAGAKATAKLAGKSFGKAVLTETLKGAAGEALEEASQEALDPVLLRLFNIDENAKLDWKNVAYAGLVGGLSGGLMTAGPAAINYKSAASAGKSIRESGETAEFLEHARLVVKGAQRKQANLTAKKDAAKASKQTKTEDGTDTAKAEKTKGKIGTFIQGRRDAKASRRVAQLAETVQKNLTAYEGYLNKADKTAKELEISDAILGEMRGNVFLLENAALLESYEEAILELSDEDKAELVADINARAKASGAEKTDYTVEDLNKDTDGILAGVAGNYLLSENYGRYLRGNQEAKAADTSESPAEAAEGEETVAGEEVEAPVKKTNKTAAWTNPGTTEDEKAIYKVAHDFGLSETETNMMLASFKKGTAMDADTFAKAYSEGIFRGRRGQNPADVTPGTLLASMNPYERQEAFEAGRTSAIETEDLREAAAKQKKAPARQADKQGKTSFVTLELAEGVRMRDLSPEAYQTYNAAKVIGEALHTDIVLHSTLGDVNGKKQNGYYNRKTGEIHIALDAGRGANGTALFTLAHEVTHYIKEWSPRKYQALADFVSERISGEMDVLVERKVNLLRTLPDYKNMTVSQLEDAAHEEVVADSMETVLSDGNVLEDLATYDNSIWQKVKSWITKAIKNIKAVYESLSPNSQAAKVLSETMTDMDKLERLFTEGVRDAGERAATAEEETRTEGEKVYSFTPADFEKPITMHDIEVLRGIGRKSINKFSSEDIKKAQKWAYKFYQEMGTKSPFFRAWFGDWRAYDTKTKLPIVPVNAETIDRGDVPRGDFKNEDTGWSITSNSDGIDETSNKEQKRSDSYHALKDINDLLKNAVLLDTVVVTDPSKRMGKNAALMHHMYCPISVNGEIGVAKLYIAESLGDKHKFYLMRIEKASTAMGFNTENGESTPHSIAATDDAMVSIAQIFEFVKEHHEDFEKNSDHYVPFEPKPVNELMLDENKEPRVFYHGTRSQFTEFILQDKPKFGRALGDGFYFTPSYSKAHQFANGLFSKGQDRGGIVMPVYLRMEKPFVIEETADRTKWRNEYHKGDYDGIIDLKNQTWYVEGSTQIKSATDNIGTFDDTNPDIRYSIDDSGEVSGSEAADNQAALERFGTTTDFEQAGFAMADGRMLKLSQYGQRGVQHRVIEGIYQDTKGDEAIARFIQNGNVRISAASPGIEISAEKPLTTNQLNVISRFASKSLAGRGSFYLDITGRDGESIASVAYDDRQSAAAIIEDIKDYYKRGRVPEESRYLYSIDEEGENRELSDTELLGMALEGVVQSEQEYKIVSDFREKARLLDLVRQHKSEYARQASAYEKQIRELKARMDESGDPDGWIRKAYSDTITKKREAERMRDEQDSILDHEARELLRLRAAKPFREVIAREQRRAKAAERREQKAKAEYEFREEYKADRREMSGREVIARRVIGRLNTMFYNPTRTKHVPADLQALVEQVLKSEKLDTFKETRKNLRQMAELEREIEKLEQNPARTASEQERLDKMLYKYAAFEDEGLAAKGQAEALFTAFQTWMKSKPKEQQDQALLDMLSSDIDKMQEMPLSQMSKESLISVENFYKMIYQQVNTANKAFATEKAANIDEMSTKATTQVKNAKDLKLLSPTGKEWAAMDGIRKFFWKNMKPLTVFEAIGSDELMSIFKRVLNGEDVWITDILEAKKALDEAKKEFGYNKWNLKERREVTTTDGSKVSLTLGEMMSLYAYMFREQAEEHLSVGGFVFAPDAKAIEKFKGSKALYKTHLNDQTPHRMRKQDIDKMSEMLTEEQRDYVKAVQEYLTKLGEKGNEVSRKLYGIDLFKETAYFPIKSSHDYIETSTGPSGDPNIKSRGTFKETVPGAGNPIVLEDFMEVVGNHVNTMATYHAFVLPVEDLTRVWNYTPVNIKRDENGKAILDENGMPVADTKGEAGYNSLKAEITKKYGKEANDYILQLLRDLNGGARRESASSILDKGITAFKRSATMLSLSTIVQQPTSIIRAMAYVDAKHFKGASFVPWETVKKYAPVAAIKEVGGHDTNTGARTVDYINAKEYDSIKDAAKAAVKPEIYGGDPNVRAEAFGWLTGKADEISWRYMFGAIINEQAERLGKPKDSEAVLKAAGERFADVVRHTQVYDSTLTRSEYMRSKDGLMKMATAFGAEPTTVISMAVDAIIKAERGDKTFFRKSAAGIAFSIIANAAVVSLIYAMRDDDEDETIPEKYVQSLTSELIEGFNPFEYLPIARDIMSMFKGYEIERSDMALIGNLMEQVELITSSKRSVPDKIFGVTGAVSAFFGLPVTNVYRDLKGLVNTGQSFIDAEEQTGAGLGHAMGDAVRGQFNLFSKIFGAESGNAYELYKAFVSGDTAHYNRVAARYESEAAVEQALRKELRERDRRIGEAAEARMAGELDVYESIIEQIEGEGIFERNMIIRAINNEINSLKDDAKQESLVPKDEEAAAEDAEEVLSLYSTKDLNDALERGDREDFSWIYQTLVTGKTEQGKTEAQAKAAVKSSVTAYWKKRYIEAWAANDTAEIKRIQSILQSTGLYGSRNDVAKLGQEWVKKYAASGK